MTAGGFERSLGASNRKKRLSGWVTVLVSLVIVGAGVGVAVAMVKTKPKATKEHGEAMAPLVEVSIVHFGDQAVTMQLSGQVLAASKVVLIPEVGGRIVWQAPELVPGGLVKGGQPLLRIDPRDYALALQQQQAQLSTQRLQLDIEKGRGRVAEKEWQIFQEERKRLGLPADGNDDGKLALRTPHIESAEVGVSAAQSNIARAELQLSKTTLIAPFNAFVQSESVDKGQLVGPTSQLATLIGTDAFWVQVSVPVDRLDYIRLPSGDDEGAHARVWMDTGSSRIERTGSVVRLMGDLDPVGRMARVLVEIPDPFRLRQNAPGAPKAELDTGDERTDASSRLPLLVGSFVRVEIDAGTIEAVAKIPRRAVQPNNEIYAVTADGKLDIRKVEQLWGGDDWILVRGPLTNGDKLIVSPLGAPVAGMAVRVVDQRASASATPAAASAPTTAP